MTFIINSMHHGFWQYCSGGQCDVCNTPWPDKQYTPLELYLKQTNYYNNYTEKGFPQGMSGTDLIELRRKLTIEYLNYEGKNAALEVKRRGAEEGYNK